MRIHHLAITLLALVTLAGFATVAAATTCNTPGFACSATTNVVQFSGTPTIPCQIGDPVVKITTTASCIGGGTAGPVVNLRCSSSTDGFTFTGGGYNHKITLRKGDWGDVLAGQCNIGYRATRI